MQAYMAPEFYRVVVNDLFLTKPVVTLRCVKCLKRLCSEQGKFWRIFRSCPSDNQVLLSKQQIWFSESNND